LEFIAIFKGENIVITISEIDEVSKLRGDADNYLKSILDGLNKIAYNDDGQILNLKGYKR